LGVHAPSTLEAMGGGLLTSRSVRTWIIGDDTFVDPIVALFAVRPERKPQGHPVPSADSSGRY